jgi:hypothetical protein
MKTGSKKKQLLPFQKRLSPSERKLNQFSDTLHSIRSCGACTACCDAVGVEELGKSEFTQCKHLCATGCAIYKKRPGQCRDYMCSWRALWTPNDESWRPDHLGVIFDVHEEGMGGLPAIRCWQLRSETQILDDAQVRRMAYALAVQLSHPVVARFGDIRNISVHLIPKLHGMCYYVSQFQPVIQSYLLTPDVISDPQDFSKERESHSDHEIREIIGQFGFKALSKHLGLN